MDVRRTVSVAAMLALSANVSAAPTSIRALSEHADSIEVSI